MLAQRLRRWANIKIALVQCLVLVFAVMCKRSQRETFEDKMTQIQHRAVLVWKKIITLIPSPYSLLLGTHTCDGEIIFIQNNTTHRIEMK